LIAPEETKLALANLQWKNSTKNTTAGILKCYYKFINKPFEKPKYAVERKLPFFPSFFRLLISGKEPMFLIVF
jgi:hypothetical protein